MSRLFLLSTLSMTAFALPSSAHAAGESQENFCDYYDGAVTLQSFYRNRYVSVEDGTVRTDTDQSGYTVFNIDCNAQGRVRFMGPRGEVIKKSGDELIATTGNPTGSYAYFWAYQDNNGNWLFESDRSGDEDTWWKEKNSSSDYAVVVRDNTSTYSYFTVAEQDPVEGFTVSWTTSTKDYADTDSPIYVQLLLSDTSVTDWVLLESDGSFDKSGEGSTDFFVDADRLDDVDVSALRIMMDGSNGWVPASVELVAMKGGAVVVNNGFDERYWLSETCDIGIDDFCTYVATVAADGDLQRAFTIDTDTSLSSNAQTDGTINAQLLLTDGTTTDWVNLTAHPRDDFEQGETNTHMFSMDESLFEDGVAVDMLYLNTESTDGWIPGYIGLIAEADEELVLEVDLLVGDGSGEGTFNLDQDCNIDGMDCADEVGIDTDGVLYAP